MSHRILSHFKCRGGLYPRSKVNRLVVPDDKVSWEIPWSDYNPPQFTSEAVFGKPWSDSDLSSETFKPIWNALDGLIDRVSKTGEYEVVDGVPRNPVGRTGLNGRGVLGRWGPNHAADPIVTRWKRNDRGSPVIHPDSQKPLLQFVGIVRKDNGEWAIPGGMVDPGEVVTKTLKREFAEEAFNVLEMNETDKNNLAVKLDEFFKNGRTVYEGYVDDPRNTDNAWMETVACNFHDDDGDTVGRFNLNAGDDAVGVSWIDISKDLKLFLVRAGNHQFMFRPCQPKNLRISVPKPRSSKLMAAVYSQTNYAIGTRKNWILKSCGVENNSTTLQQLFAFQFFRSANDDDHEKKSSHHVETASHLETMAEHQQRWASIRVMYFTVFLMSLGFSIVITGIWPYLHTLDHIATKEFMGYVVAAHPFAQMLFSPLVGWWGNRLGKARLPLITTIIIFIISSAVYSTVEIFPYFRRYAMFTARFFIGASSANMALCRAYISAATKLEERTRAVAMISLAQLLGFIVGPGLQAAVTPLGDRGYVISENQASLNMFTAAGWINVVLGIINLILVLPRFFQERTIAAREAMLLSSAASEKDAWKQVKPDYVSAWTLIIAFFILTFNFVLLESLGTTLTQDQFAWTDQQALSYLGIMLSVGGVIACVTSACIDRICKLFGEVRVLLWGGFFLMVGGQAVCIPWGSQPAKIAYPLNLTAEEMVNSTIQEELGCPSVQEWCLYTPGMTLTQFILGFALTSVGYAISITLIQTLFSKILGPRPQGVWMGLITGSGCLSRIIGPVFVVYVYTRLGTIWTFGMTTVLMIFSLIWLQLVSKRLANSCMIAISIITESKNGPNRKPTIELVDLGSDI